ncbi:hypothetical protein [Rhodopila sp.]|uniref:hypothetical protein n=1 Tax=Rhodopila sp. TaxID=2480087 RepID=UPI003D0CF624
MSVSISGQNDRAALVSAYQAISSSSPDQGGDWDSAVGPSTDPTTGTASPSGTSGALSDGTAMALLAFGNATDASAPATGENGAGDSSADPVSAQSAGSQSGWLTDIQSVLSALTGTSTSGVGSAGTITGVDGSLPDDPETVTAGLGTSASGSSGAQPTGLPPSWGNDISNLGTIAPDGTANQWKPGYSDSFQQQFALSAYSANATPGVDPATASSLAAINV